ncbi:dodecin family protein [Prescottella defluvii]|nr:dodecin family protein [Prescottella defluvii]
MIKVVGSSTEGVDAAIANAIDRASQTMHNLDWFEVVETRGHIENGTVAHTQVTLEVGFRLD